MFIFERGPGRTAGSSTRYSRPIRMSVSSGLTARKPFSPIRFIRAIFLPRNIWSGRAGCSTSNARFLLHADKCQIDEPGLRRDKALHLGAHRARVEVVNDVKPWRVIDQPF